MIKQILGNLTKVKSERVYRVRVVCCHWHKSFHGKEQPYSVLGATEIVFSHGRITLKNWRNCQLLKKCKVMARKRSVPSSSRLRWPSWSTPTSQVRSLSPHPQQTMRYAADRIVATVQMMGWRCLKLMYKIPLSLTDGEVRLIQVWSE